MDADYIKMMYQYDLLYGNGKTHVEMAFNGKTYLDLDFQEGAVKEDKDINGCTIEDLLVLAHARLNYYQGTLPDYHNEMALRHIEEALLDLSSRMTARYLSTVDSTNRNVDYKSLTPSKVMEESKKSPIISKLAHLEIASEDYVEGDKKYFTWDEAMKIGEKVNYVNPPYGRELPKWIKKGYEEWQRGKIVVFLIPSRTDTSWWHDYCMKASEIRYIRGRLKFDDQPNPAPFPSAIVIFKKKGLK